MPMSPCIRWRSRDEAVDPSARESAATIIAMAHNLNLTVIAEGVETPEQLAFLTSQGCPTYQGYLFGRPLSAEEFAKLASTYSPRPSN
jgi:EAL domain-containing protein (putative c-di-GMP-specific phosphodiesterase class I)